MLRSSISRHLALGARASACALTATGLALPAAVSGSSAAAALAVGGLHTSSSLLASLLVKIPALGESISDGTVAAVLKEAGQRVEEDEPILQIETDKVTVDVRAPRAGVLEAILVKTDDNVEVGQAVASIAEGATTAAAAPQQEQQQAAPAVPPPAAEAAPTSPPKQAAAQAAAQATPTHRTPSIRFPPRRTAEGKQISMLPAAEAKEALANMLGGDADVAPATAKPTFIPVEYRNMIAVPIVGGSMPTLRGMPVPAGAPGPPRRSMTDAEVEAIMLGGADP